MDFKKWKRFKRSGTYGRQVRKLFKKISTSVTIDTRQNQGEASNTDNGSVQSVTSYKQMPVNSNHVDFDNLEADQSDSEGSVLPVTSGSESSSSDIDEKNKKLCNELKNWAIEFNISHEALKRNMELINTRLGSMVLPRDPRTLLETANSSKTDIISMGTGLYWHNSLIKSLCDYLQVIRTTLPKISLNINIDGLPSFKSSKHQLWPILVNIYEIPYLQPFVVGIYSGQEKPSDINSYLRMFVDEMKMLLENGISITIDGTQNKIDVKIRAFICDSPARALIKGVCNFNGKDGCLKCTIEGEYSYVSHTVIFPRVGCPKRTDEDFRAKKYGQHHKVDSPLLELPIDMVEDFVVADALHLLDLGIMKRLLTGWRDGKFGKFFTKWSSSDIAMVSIFLLRCKMPKEIHRAVRGLDNLAFWKGTEYRTFLYYLSYIILQYALSSDAYKHFLCFFCAIVICSNETYFHFLDLADSLLKTFLEHFRDIYAEDYMTSNVHNLSHLVDEVKKFGKLQDFSAYPFENQLQCLKKMIRHGNKPLAQVARRITERSKVELQNLTSTTKIVNKPFIKTNKSGKLTGLQLPNFMLSLRNEDKWFLDTNNHVVEVLTITEDENGIIIRGNRIEPLTDVFFVPLKSSYLHIYQCENNVMRRTGNIYRIETIKSKLVSITYRSITYFAPLLHTL